MFLSELKHYDVTFITTVTKIMNKQFNKRRSTKKSSRNGNNLAKVSNRSGKVSDVFIKEYNSLKFMETQLVGTATNATPLYALLNWPATGAGYSARSGNCIGIPYIDVNYSVAPSTNGYNNCRIVVMQQTGSLTAVSIASYFLATSAGVVPESVYNPGMNQENKVLYDATHSLNTEGSNGIITRRVRIKPAIGKIVFNGNGTVVWRGNIFIFIICGPGSVGVDLNAQCIMHYSE